MTNKLGLSYVEEAAITNSLNFKDKNSVKKKGVLNYYKFTFWYFISLIDITTGLIRNYFWPYFKNYSEFSREIVLWSFSLPELQNKKWERKLLCIVPLKFISIKTKISDTKNDKNKENKNYYKYMIKFLTQLLGFRRCIGKSLHCTKNEVFH